jgi:hypothetical protein
MTARYRGDVLTDDDAGYDDVLLALHHLARTTNPRRRIAYWLEWRAPWFHDDELIEQILAAPSAFKADQLAKRIGLTDERRSRLKIKTIGAIDVPKKEREKRRKAKDAEYRRARRRKAGAKPRAEYEAQSTEQTKPWLALGISRRTWFRRRDVLAKEQSPNINETTLAQVRRQQPLISPYDALVPNRMPCAARTPKAEPIGIGNRGDIPPRRRSADEIRFAASSSK